MQSLNPYQPSNPTDTTASFSEKQQNYLKQREQVRTRRKNRALKQKLHNIGLGAVLGGPSTVITSSALANIFAGIQWPENLILIPLVVPGAVAGGVYGAVKGSKLKQIPIPKDDFKLREFYRREAKKLS